jgi:cytochrome P450
MRCVQDIFSAGSETSTTVLEWVMAELIRNSKAMQRATAEVRSVFSAHGTVPEHGLGELRYLHHVIRETLRLHPPAPLLLPRVAREPCRVLGYDVQPGTAVIVNAWALGRDERYWPGDPDEFRPERFDEIGDVDFRGADLQLLPFGAGRRMCPGMLFGLANVELPLANLLFHFDWEVPGVAEPTDFDMTETFGVTVRRKSGLLLRPILRIPARRGSGCSLWSKCRVPIDPSRSFLIVRLRCVKMYSTIAILFMVYNKFTVLCHSLDLSHQISIR